MANISKYFEEGASIDYTPASAVYSGNLVNLGSVSGFTPRDVGASELGALRLTGVIRAPYVGGYANVGDNIWWDANGTPYGGSADGACTRSAPDGDWWVGTLVKAAAATDATCDVALNKVNPNLPAWPNRTHVATAVDLNTWVAATHNGKVIHVTKDPDEDTTIIFPIGVAGMEAIIVNDEEDGKLLLQVDWNGSETCEGNLTIAATKLANLTKTTGKRGDYLHLVCETAAGIWRCQEKRGTWVSSA